MDLELEFDEIKRKEIEVPELTCSEKYFKDKFSRQFIEGSVALVIGSAGLFIASGYDSTDITYLKFLSSVLMFGAICAIVSLNMYHKGKWFKREKIKFYQKINEERNPRTSVSSYEYIDDEAKEENAEKPEEVDEKEKQQE